MAIDDFKFTTPELLPEEFFPPRTRVAVFRASNGEQMPAVSSSLFMSLQTEGVAVVIKATHGCMTTRGVQKHGSSMVTSRMLGCFRDNPATRHEFMSGLSI